MPSFQHLFAPGHIAGLALRNRIVMAPMQTFTYGPHGVPDQITIDYFVARAQGGAGLIICPGAKPSLESHAPGTPALYDDQVIPHFKRLTEAIHAQGAKVAQQINHTGKALTYNQAKGEQSDILGPSATRYVKTGVVLRQASLEDIGRITEQIAQAARRAQEAGFDMVELHAAHGYLLGSFLSSFSNRSDDAYGGSPEKRARFLCEIIPRIRQVVGPEFPVGVRISGSEYLPGGTTIEDTLIQAPLLERAGASALHISAGAHREHRSAVPVLSLARRLPNRNVRRGAPNGLGASDHCGQAGQPRSGRASLGRKPRRLRGPRPPAPGRPGLAQQGGSRRVGSDRLLHLLQQLLETGLFPEPPYRPPVLHSQPVGAPRTGLCPHSGPEASPRGGGGRRPGWPRAGPGSGSARPPNHHL